VVVGGAALSAIAACVVARLPHGLLLLAVLGPLAYGVVVFVASSMKTAGGPDPMRVLEWIGLRSYSLYLTHPIALTLAAVLLTRWVQGPAALATLAFASAYLMAALYFALVERRFLNPARRGAGPPPTITTTAASWPPDIATSRVADQDPRGG
jgi:peptidoglycan/LPS O-acetylase OafA/YrhL